MVGQVKAGIVAVGKAVPPKVLTNDDLAKIVDTNDEWIRTRTGISERHIASDDVATSDLAAEAARSALQDAGMVATDIDLLIVASVTPDMMFPSTSCLVQGKIGASGAVAFDVAAGCSGFIYALSVARAFVESGMYHRVLVVGADVLSRVVDWTDRSTCVLFGDGAGAAIVSDKPAAKGYFGELVAIELGSDGSGAELIRVDAGGSRMPASEETVRNRLHYIRMAGNQVYKFATRIMGDVTLSVLARAGLSKDEVDRLIPHQANIRIINYAAKLLELPPEKVYTNVQKYGNTSAASIPIALTEAVDESFIEDDDNVVLVGFGSGLTWGAALLKWHSQCTCVAG